MERQLQTATTSPTMLIFRLLTLLLALTPKYCWSQPRTTARPNVPLDFKVIRHHACIIDNPSYKPKIIFANSSQSVLEEEPGNPGCYWLKGFVRVYSKLKADRLQIYVNATNHPEQPHRNRCLKYDDDGCGGVGSCLYCHTCKMRGKHEDALKRKQVQLTMDGKELNCAQTLNIGHHENIALHFCMPTRKEFLESQGHNESVIDNLVGAPGGFNSVNLFLKVIMFDQDYSENQKKTLRLERLVRGYFNLPDEHAPTPWGKAPPGAKNPIHYDKLPMGKILKNYRTFIGCHVIVGTVTLT